MWSCSEGIGGIGQRACSTLGDAFGLQRCRGINAMRLKLHNSNFRAGKYPDLCARQNRLGHLFQSGGQTWRDGARPFICGPRCHAGARGLSHNTCRTMGAAHDGSATQRTAFAATSIAPNGGTAKGSAISRAMSSNRTNTLSPRPPARTASPSRQMTRPLPHTAPRSWPGYGLCRHRSQRGAGYRPSSPAFVGIAATALLGWRRRTSGRQSAISWRASTGRSGQPACPQPPPDRAIHAPPRRQAPRRRSKHNRCLPASAVTRRSWSSCRCADRIA